MNTFKPDYICEHCNNLKDSFDRLQDIERAVDNLENYFKSNKRYNKREVFALIEEIKENC